MKVEYNGSGAVMGRYERRMQVQRFTQYSRKVVSQISRKITQYP